MILAKFVLKTLFLLFVSLAGSAIGVAAESTERGKIVGGITHEAPAWFKESFLEIQDDVDEANEQGKHVLLFFQLNECPYCDRMLSESFEAEPMTDYIQKHFDTIAINVRGDRDIVFNEDISVTEKELSEILKIRATPAIVFLNKDNKTVVRVNGYRARERFQRVLEFVATSSYRTTTLADFLQAKLSKDVYRLRENPLFDDLDDLSGIKGPLMLIIEDGSCYDCNEFHDGILAHPDVQKEIEPFTIVRLDAESGETIIDVNGHRATPSEIANNYNMIYRPGVLMFDEGKLVRRYDSLVYPFHFKEGIRYAAGKFYKVQNYRSYSKQRTEELLDAGVVIDVGRSQ